MNTYRIFLLCLLTNIAAAQTDTVPQPTPRLLHIDSMRAAVPKLPQPKHPFTPKITTPQPESEIVYTKRDQNVAAPQPPHRSQDASLWSGLLYDFLRCLLPQ